MRLRRRVSEREDLVFCFCFCFIIKCREEKDPKTSISDRNHYQYRVFAFHRIFSSSGVG